MILLSTWRDVLGNLANRPRGELVSFGARPSTLDDMCFVSDSADLAENEDVPAEAEALGWRTALLVEEIQSILTNLRGQVGEPAPDLVVRAIAYYVNNNAFLTVHSGPTARQVSDQVNAERRWHIAGAVVGTILLLLACLVFLGFAGLSAMLTDNCSGPEGAAKCANAGAVTDVLMYTPFVMFPLSLLLTFLPRKGRPGPYAPRGWVPFAGLGVLLLAWSIADSLSQGNLT